MAQQDINGANWKQIFPSAVRANSNADYLTARKMTEWNVTNIIRMLADNDSFVISDAFDSAKDFEFCIHGYYFCIAANKFNTVTGFQSGPIWAKITLTHDTDTKDYYSELSKIEFYDLAQTDSDTEFSLQLLNGDRQIPQESLIKFTQQSIDMTSISNTILSNITTIDGNYPPPSPPSQE